ncbi:Abi-alpha family protein [Sulfurospirillum arcachonense]|uniref:Abi-alpha family protein n=1 Tax=Sulfurospirillum arcachonense TaxID=57666 RepID=UPI00046A7009|nr:Abi-alpha family protein [Sulfurospirillum arcachonense]
MQDKNDSSLDILGVKPIAKSIEKTTEKALEGTGAFLSRICLPAAEEFGLLLQDKVKSWRAKNTRKILNLTEEKLAKQDLLNSNIKSHPLITWKILENSSWSTDDEIQNLWAGLLASSCTEDGLDDSNLVYINLLAQMTNSQVKILNFACEHAEIYKHENGLIQSKDLFLNTDELIEITGLTDIHDIDRDLDYMMNLGITGMLSGFQLIDNKSLESKGLKARINPSALGIQLFVRSQGYLGNPLEYFNLEQNV